jgi:hypothetical protein
MIEPGELKIQKGEGEDEVFWAERDCRTGSVFNNIGDCLSP